jgi:hypothetical protein
MTEDHQAYIDKQIAELRVMILGQIREIFDLLASLRAELREVRLRQEKHESIGRRH